MSVGTKYLLLPSTRYFASGQAFAPVSHRERNTMQNVRLEQRKSLLCVALFLVNSSIYTIDATDTMAVVPYDRSGNTITVSFRSSS